MSEALGHRPPTRGGLVVELLVHGVSGTPPEAMLRYPSELIDEVTGDAGSGIYSRREDGLTTYTAESGFDDEATSGRAPPPNWTHRTEAYSWGGLTSGRASQALWVCFLPFVLIDVAHWMVPPAKKGSRTAAAAASASVWLLRLLAFSFTLSLLLSVVLLAVDLIGWQCAALPQCGARLGPLRFLADRSAGVRLTLTAIPVAGLVGGLVWFGRGDRPAGEATPPGAAVKSDDVPLADPNFWVVDASVARLRRCHVTAWLSGLACVVLLGAGQRVVAAGGWSQPATLMLTVRAPSSSRRRCCNWRTRRSTSGSAW
jgi:hypothetical protein